MIITGAYFHDRRPQVARSFPPCSTAGLCAAFVRPAAALVVLGTGGATKRCGRMLLDTKGNLPVRGQATSINNYTANTTLCSF